MAEQHQLQNRVRARRIGQGWSQEELAARTGISRAGISAIEMGRLVPLATAVLALARAFDCRVEELFTLAGNKSTGANWAWAPRRETCRYWHANVAGQTWMYPCEEVFAPRAHDGVFHDGVFETRSQVEPSDVLVVASCDPAVGYLAEAYRRLTGYEMLALTRTSNDALDLLARGLVHVAAIHLEPRESRGHNAAAAARIVKPPFCLLRTAFWQEGLAVAPNRRIGSVEQAIDRKLRWVGREASSAAGELQRKLLSGQTPKRIARSHRGVAEAVRCGWADVGVCVRLVCEEAELDFIAVREETCDLCFSVDYPGDPRCDALVETVRSINYRSVLQDLPGYDVSEIGQLERIDSN